MPMHYPPLADGTYRYGDTPRPLPSPLAGPGSEPPGQPDPTAQPGPTGQPQQTEHPLPTGREAPVAGRPKGTVAAATIVGGLGLVVVVFLGAALFGLGAGGGPGGSSRGPALPGAGQLPGGLSDPAPGAPFTVDGHFTVVSAPGAPVSGDGSGCTVPPSMSDIGETTRITLLDATGTPIGRAGLTYDQGDLSSCTFTFEFPDVPGGESFYRIELPGRGELVYTEDELRAGVDITLGR